MEPTSPARTADSLEAPGPPRRASSSLPRAPSQLLTPSRSVTQQRPRIYSDERRQLQDEDSAMNEQANRWSNRNPSQAARLQESSPPIAPQMARHPSSNSSLTRRMENTAIQDASPQPPGANKSRGGRTGPLKPQVKADAADKRRKKLVCESCRRRKVSCDAKNPQCERRNARGTGPYVAQKNQATGDRAEILAEVWTGQQSDHPQHNGGYPDPDNLLNGVGPEAELRVAEALSDPMLLTVGGSNTAGMVRGAGVQDMLMPAINSSLYWSNRPPSQNTWGPPLHGPPTSLGPSSDSGHTEISVARELEPLWLGNYGLWECAYENCGTVTIQIDDAKAHYGTKHYPFHTYHPPFDPFRWRCRGCGAVHPNPKPAACSNPSCTGTEMQQQYHGYTSGGSVRHPGSAVEVANPHVTDAVNNPAGLGQTMSHSRHARGQFSQQGTGAYGGPPSYSSRGSQLGKDTEPDEAPRCFCLDMPGDSFGDIADGSGLDGNVVSTVVPILDIAVLYALGLWRPSLVPIVLLQRTVLVFIALLLVPLVIAACESTQGPSRLALGSGSAALAQRAEKTARSAPDTDDALSFPADDDADAAGGSRGPVPVGAATADQRQRDNWQSTVREGFLFLGDIESLSSWRGWLSSFGYTPPAAARI